MILKKSINYLLILIAIPLCAVHCCDHCPCENCPPCIPKDTPFVWDTIFSENLDNSGEKVIVSSTNSVPKYAYGIRLNFKVKPYPKSSNYDTCIVLIPPDTIVSFKIFTKYDFDATHPANSDISDYFKVGLFNENGSKDYSYNGFSPINDYLKNYDQKKFDQIDFLLMTAPQLNLSHEFKVEIDYSNSIFYIPVKAIDLY